jgi:hypothetical protein
VNLPHFTGTFFLSLGLRVAQRAHSELQDVSVGHDIVVFNPLNAELNPIRHFIALLGAHPILHVSRISVNCLCIHNLGRGRSVVFEVY